MYLTYHIISNETFHCIFRESKLLKIEHIVPRSCSPGAFTFYCVKPVQRIQSVKTDINSSRITFDTIYWYERTKVRKCSFGSTNSTEIIKLARAGRKLKEINFHFRLFFV